MDFEALTRWDEYTTARDTMLEETHSLHAPWTVVRTNDKRRARINVIRHVLMRLDYDERDDDSIGVTDPDILGHGPDFITGL